MHRSIAALILTSVILAPLYGCGGNKRCTEKTPASFPTFLDEEWRGYCAEYKLHIESPGDYSMPQLAAFFSEHPERVKELNKSLYSHEKYETCFESPREELELRQLQSCLQDNDESDIEISQAFNAVADPWIQDLELRVGGISPRVINAEQEAARLSEKVEMAFDRTVKLEGRDFEALQTEVDEIGKALAAVEGADAAYREMVTSAKGHEALTEKLQGEIGPKINALVADAGSLRSRHKVLVEKARFLEFGWLSAGVPCPKSTKGANKELSVAKKVVSGRNAEVGGSGPRILRKTRPDTSGDTDFERFEGFVCGQRGEENQFEGQKRLCGEFRFVVERQKEAGESQWDDWTLKSFEESGSTGGVDCTLKKK